MSEVLVNPYRYAPAGFDKSGILVYYQFCESSGDLINKATTANGFSDGLGNAQDSDSVGGSVVYGESGIIGDAYDFNGTSSTYVGLPGSIVSGTGAYSFNIWLYHDAEVGGNDTVLRCFNQGIAQYQGATDKYIAGNGPVLATTSTIGLNSWDMLTYTRDASNNATVYFNGESENTGSNSTDLATGIWQIGGRSTGVEMWNGKVDELLVANIELSADQVTELYADGAGLSLI